MHVTCCERAWQRRGYPGFSLARVRLTTCCVDVTNVGDKGSIVEVLSRFFYLTASLHTLCMACERGMPIRRVTLVDGGAQHKHLFPNEGFFMTVCLIF
jgi:hypothetical protein